MLFIDHNIARFYLIWLKAAALGFKAPLLDSSASCTEKKSNQTCMATFPSGIKLHMSFLSQIYFSIETKKIQVLRKMWSLKLLPQRKINML